MRRLATFIALAAALAAAGCGGGSGKGPAPQRASAASFVATPPDRAFYLEWTRRGDAVRGALVESRINGITLVETSRALFSGTIDGAGVALDFHSGGETELLRAGTLNGDKLTLHFVDAGGKIADAAFTRRGRADYNAALDKLHARAQGQRLAARCRVHTCRLRVGPAALRNYAALLHQPLYWAGRQPNRTIEFTRTADGRFFIRYLTPGARVGDPHATFLTIGTYPQPNALATVRKGAAAAGATQIKLPQGGLAQTSKALPTSVYVAYPRAAWLVEVFDPSAATARRLVRSGKVTTVDGRRPTG